MSSFFLSNYLNLNGFYMFEAINGDALLIIQIILIIRITQKRSTFYIGKI